MINLRNTIYYKSIEGLSREIWLLAIVMFINRSGAMVLPFLSIYLNQELNISLAHCGIIMSFYGLGSVFGAFLGGVLTDRLGYVPVMISSLFLTSIAFLVVMNLQSFNMLCIGIFTVSFLADLFRPANLSAIQEFSKEENITRSLGLIRLAINLGYSFGPFVGGLIAASLGYKLLFIANAISVALAGLFFIKFFRSENRIPIKNKSKAEVVVIQMPWKDLSYLLYLFLFMIIVTVFMQLFYIVPLYYKTSFGFNESFVGFLMGLNGLIIFILEMPLIYKAEKTSPIKLVVIGGMLMGLSCFSLLVIPIALIAALFYIIFSTFGEMLAFPFSNTFALSFCNEMNRGKYMGLYTMTFSIAHTIAPFLWFKISELYGFEMIWIVGGTAAVLASAGIFIYKLKMA